jgi:hypothetical protein
MMAKIVRRIVHNGGWRMIDMPPFLPLDGQKKTDSDDR